MSSDYRTRLYAAYVRASAGSIDQVPALESRQPYLQQVIDRHFPGQRSASILEVGCGSGALIKFARDAGYTNINGVDRSPEQVALARRLGLDCVEEGDALAAIAATPPGALDAVIAFDVVEHLTKPEVLDFLDATLRALRDGGRLILHVPNAESPFGGLIRYGDFTHELAFTRQSIGQLATVTGFRSVACHEDRPVPHGAKSIVRWALWPLVRLVYRLLTAVETGDPGGSAVLTRNMVVVAVK